MRDRQSERSLSNMAKSPSGSCVAVPGQERRTGSCWRGEHSTTRLTSRPPLSRRKRKLELIPPSVLLDRALREVGCTLYQKPQWISNASDMTQKPGSTDEVQVADVTLPWILSRYILCKFRSESTSKLLLHASQMEVLHKKGYAEEDLDVWAKILLEPSSTTALETLTKLERPPMFLILRTLQRVNITGRGLRILIQFLARQFNSLKEREPQTAPQPSSPGPEVLRRNRRHPTVFHHYDTIFLVTVRLLAKARELPDPPFDAITTLAIWGFSRLFAQRNLTSRASRRNRASKATLYLNKILAAIGMPTKVHPKASAHARQNAQFDLLRFMQSQQPPITIARRGYRGLIRVQLANGKTPDEIRWAKLKRASWPPWKEDRTGLDADITPREHGTSRAGKVLNWMTEAGYDVDEWERIASIYSGWDVDGSPTIQRRESMLGFDVGSGFRLKNPRDAKRRMEKVEEQIWAARIRTTRTLQEAWACFLAYEKACDRVYQDVYLAMCEKLRAYVYDEASLKEHQILPGDSMEVFPEPVSAYEQTYVERPVPSFNAFVDEMTGNQEVTRGRLANFRYSGKLLRFLLENVDLQRGVRIIDRCHPAHLKETVTRMACPETPSIINESPIPRPLFAAYVRFICNNHSAHPHHLSKSRLLGPATLPTTDSRSEKVASLNLKQDHPLVYVFFLLLRQKPYFVTPYIVLAQELARVKTPRIHPKAYNDFEYKNSLACVQVTQILVATIKEVGLDIPEAFFQSMCKILFRAVDSYKENGFVDEDMLQKHRIYVRSLFQEMVSVQRETEVERSAWPISGPDRSVLVLVPKAYTVHHVIRVLGILGDHEGVLSLANFLVEFELQLDNRWRLFKGTLRKARAVVVALRVFVEGRWPGCEAAPESIQTLVRDNVESLKSEWGGWPTDEEVRHYVSTGVNDWWEESGNSSSEQDV